MKAFTVEEISNFMQNRSALSNDVLDKYSNIELERVITETNTTPIYITLKELS